MPGYNYVCEPELKIEAPRPVRFSNTIRNLRLALRSSLCIILGVILVVGINDFSEVVRLKNSGMRTIAQVIGGYTLREHGVDICHLNVTYYAQRTKMSVEDVVDKQTYDSHPIGSSISVVFDPQNPGTFRIKPAITDEKIRQTLTYWLVICVVVTTFFAWLIWLVEVDINRQKRLLSRGSVVAAQIVTLEPVNHKLPDGVYRLTYRYEISGATAIERTVGIYAHYAEQLRTQSHVTVLVDPSKPTTQKPYVAFRAVVLDREA